MPCIVCTHNQVKDIDRALLAGASLTSLHQTYSFSLADLQRHHQNLKLKMAQAEKRFHDGLSQGLFLKLNLAMEMVFSVVQGAKTGGDFRLFLRASREFSRILGLMHKIPVRLDQEFIYCLAASPQWDLQEENLLPAAFQAWSNTRQTLKVNLFAPCPEPDSQPAPDMEISPSFKPRPPKFVTPHTRRTIFRQRQNGAEKLSRSQREKSAKSAPKITPDNDFIIENQSDNRYKK